jgi:2-haloacid dehalogenase
MTLRLCVFDAYGTLFDVNAAARIMAEDDPKLAAVWPRLAEDWRRKQLEYSWLREIMGDYADFWQLTSDALDWALEAAGLTDPELHSRLMRLYRELPAYPEVPAMLAQLRDGGIGRAILSNGSPEMLTAAIVSAGIDGLLDAAISVSDLRRYKPAAAVYSMIPARFSVEPSEVLFVSSNGWDAAGAARAGFQVAWVNRAGAPVDRLPHRPHHQLQDLSQIPALF